MKKYSPVIWGITLLLLLVGSVGCNLIEDSYHPKNILGYPSPSESIIQWGGHTPKITANIISVDVECIPLNRGKADTRIIGGKREPNMRLLRLRISVTRFSIRDFSRRQLLLQILKLT